MKTYRTVSPACDPEPAPSKPARNGPAVRSRVVYELGRSGRPRSVVASDLGGLLELLPRLAPGSFWIVATTWRRGRVVRSLDWGVARVHPDGRFVVTGPGFLVV
jgi:hypothetical protein